MGRLERSGYIFVILVLLFLLIRENLPAADDRVYKPVNEYVRPQRSLDTQTLIDSVERYRELYALDSIYSGVMVRVQHEKKARTRTLEFYAPDTIRITDWDDRRPIFPNYLERIEARLDSLEAKLERAHVVAVPDTSYITIAHELKGNWDSKPTIFPVTEQRIQYRYEISFEADSLKGE